MKINAKWNRNNRACYDDNRLDRLYDRDMTIIEVLTRQDGEWAYVTDADRIWVLTRPDVLTREQMINWLNRLVKRAREYARDASADDAARAADARAASAADASAAAASADDAADAARADDAADAARAAAAYAARAAAYAAAAVADAAAYAAYAVADAARAAAYAAAADACADAAADAAYAVADAANVAYADERQQQIKNAIELISDAS